MSLFMVGAAPGSVVRAAGVDFNVVLDVPRQARSVDCPRRGCTDISVCEDCVHLRAVAPDGSLLRCAVSGGEPVHDWMTLAGELVTTSLREHRLDALQLAEAAGVHHLLVVDEGRTLLGIVCRCDLARDRDADVGACMPVDVYATGPATSLSEAAAAMRLLDISCLPIVQGTLVLGAITRGDLRRAGAPDV